MTNDNFSNFKTSSVVVVVVVDNAAAVVAATNTEERERESLFLIQEPSHISIIPFR